MSYQTITSNNTGLWSGNSIHVYPNNTTTYPYNPNVYLSTGTTYINIPLSESFDIRIKDNSKLESLLSVCYKKIKNECIYFSVYLEGDEIKPIDKVLMMIEKEITFDFNVNRTGYILSVKNAKFKKIKNLIETSANEYIIVEFDYESMNFKNILKSKEVLRSEKIDLLKHKLKNNDI